MSYEEVAGIASKLDTLIRIQALAAVSHLPTKTQKILFLNEAGLSPKEIAPIVDAKPNVVSQLIYDAKKKAEKADKKAKTK
ncbi:MAG TPA: sigma factor-like helix-turn-helix DNA-binding protein [Sphingomonadaceae bacterium]